MAKEVDFFKIINNFDPLNDQTLTDLKKVTEAFPYFQSSHVFYAKALKFRDDQDYQKVLNKTAILSSNRSVLKIAIDSPIKLKAKPVKLKTTKQKAVPTKTKTVKPVVKKEAEIEAEVKIEKTNSAEIELSFTDWIIFTEEKGIQTAIEKSPLSDKLSIIDRFIENDPKISPVGKAESSPIEVENIYQPEELMTETLAKVFVKQKKYGKAIRAYKILSLKYPEKNVFFAGQIKEIKRLQKQ